MNCYNHPETTIVATCQDCNKGLCNECAKTYEFPICSYCNDQRFKGEKTDVNQRLIGFAVAGIIGMGIGLTGKPLSFMGLITSLFGCVALYSGWRQTSKITSNMFLFLPIIGWLFYFIVKIMASLFVGFISAPLEIFNILRQKNSIKKRQS